jgi:hypothetical protein
MRALHLSKPRSDAMGEKNGEDPMEGASGLAQSEHRPDAIIQTGGRRSKEVF